MTFRDCCDDGRAGDAPGCLHLPHLLAYLPACFSPSTCMMTFRFWDCCGEEREDAPGCITGWHLDLLFSPDLQVLGLLR